MVSAEIEDLCGNEYDRGLGRVYVCSLPASIEHAFHKAHPWHNLSSPPQAVWTDERLVMYRSQLGEAVYP